MTTLSAQTPFFLCRGGPFYRWGRHVRLAASRRRLVIALVVATYLPLLILGAVEVLFLGRSVGLLRDFSVHVRGLIGIPLMVAVEVVLDGRCAECVERFGRDFAVGGPRAVHAATMRARALRDSPLAEGIFLAVAMFAGQVVLWGRPPFAVAMHAVPPNVHSSVVIWYCVFSLPVWQFLLLRALWRWLIWSYVLVKLSRVQAHALPLHPDITGGLSFMRLPVMGMSLIAFATNAVVCSGWLTKVVFDGARALDFKMAMAVLVVLEALVAFVPLGAFVPMLYRTWLRGVRLHGRLADETTRAFDERWIERKDAPPLLDASDSSSMIDYSSTFAVLGQMRYVPVGPRDVVRFVVVCLIPGIPLILSEVSLAEALRWVAHALVGGAS